jgi:hypothetical protein
MNDNQLLGRRRMIEAINNGDNLIGVLNDLVSTRSNSVGADIYGGAISCLVSTFCAMRKAGVKFQSEDPKVREFLSTSDTQIWIDITRGINGGDSKAAWRSLSVMCDVVTQLRGTMAPQWTNAAGPMAAREATAPAVPVEQILKVEVVSMPARAGGTVITRDSANKITGSAYHETDV